MYSSAYSYGSSERQQVTVISDSYNKLHYHLEIYRSHQTRYKRKAPQYFELIKMNMLQQYFVCPKLLK